MLVHLGKSKSSDADNISQYSLIYHHKRVFSSLWRKERCAGLVNKQPSYGIAMASPLIDFSKISQLG